MHERTLALAIDLGGTKVDAALVDDDGAVVTGTVHRAPTGRDAARDDVARAIVRVAADALAGLGDDRLAGIGIGSAGPVDLGQGAIAPLNLPALAGLP
ncbi:ROK family protein, partial [Microbacterium sp.]